MPEERLNAPEIIAYWGYPCEIHRVTTEDGYVLEMHRIPHGRANEPFSWESKLAGQGDREKRKPVDDEFIIRKSNRPVFYLQHGLLSTSADWITNLPNQSAGFLLADSGFDVWLGNSRGNFYSSEHINMSRSDQRYWEFTWDEMAARDLPAMVDKALKISGQPYLYYMGHSQGTEIMFARLSEGDQRFAKKIRKFFALAPVGAVAHIKGLIAFLGRHFGLWALRWIFGTHDFMPHTWFSTMFAELICGEWRWENPLCDNVLFQIGGPETKQFNQSRLMVYMAHTPAGTSTWNIIHWAQMRQSGRVQMFDFGNANANRRHYGQDTPPIYNISRIRNVPIYMYYSESDWLGDAVDVRGTLLKQIPGEWIKLARNLPHFNHFDFIWGLLAPKEIYAEIIQVVTNHEKLIRKKLDPSNNDRL